MTKELITSRRTLIGSATVGAAMMAAFAGKAAAAEPTAQEKANIALVTAFLDSTQPKDFTKALTYLDPNCVYRMTETTPPAKGHAAIVETLRGFVDNADKITFQIFASQAMGPIVINHRLDTFTSKTHPLLFEGVGMFFIKNGKIAEWTDYTIRAALSNEWPKPRG